MLKSKELRGLAWNSLKGKYWKAFLAMIIIGLMLSIGDVVVSVVSIMLNIDISIIEEGVATEYDFAIYMLELIKTSYLVYLAGAVVKVLINGPILVGDCSYFLKNTETKPSLKEIFSGFKKRYGRNVNAMLTMEIYIFLWMLLFIVPGIIKSYSYAMLPYILADDPNVSTKEAFAISRKMMKGNKWRLFKLEFSFIGWFFLCVLTLGIGVFFIVPYIEAAHAEFYKELKSKEAYTEIEAA